MLRIRRNLFQITGIALGTMMSAAQAGAQSGAGSLQLTQQTLLHDFMWNNPTSTQIDSAGNIHIAYMTQVGTDSNTKEIWYARRSCTGDVTFTRITNNTVREEFPCLALDAQENVHIAFHTGAATSNLIRYVNNIGQAPGSFNPIVEITGPGYVITRIAVDSKGTVHFAFRTQFSGSPQEIMYTTWNASTGVGPLVNISNSPGTEDSTVQLALDANDKVHIVWQRGSALGGPLAYVHNINGSWFGPNTGVTGSIVDANLVISSAGVITIFYRPTLDSMMYIQGEVGSNAFTTPQPVYTGTYRSAFIERFAVDANGYRYVAFASNVAANPGTFLVRETAEGFQPPQLLSNPATGNQGASIDINPAGELALTYQTSGVNNGQVYADIFLVRGHVGTPCPADVAPGCGDAQVNVSDLLAVINAWGACPAPPSGCPADVTADGNVNVSDLLAVINAWGVCP